MLFFFLYGFSSLYGQEIPNIVLTISSDQINWTKNLPATVIIKIENVSNKELKLPSGIAFYLDDGTRGEHWPTMRNGAYYAPFSFNKKYSSSIRHCQNDLDEKAERREGPIVRSFRDDTALLLKAGGYKEFHVGLAELCWAHQISSVYPMSPLFSEVKTGKHTLYFSMRFRTGTIIQEGISTPIPISKSIESNKLTINIK